MDQIATGALIFLIGVTLCGIAGSLLELIAGFRLSFSAPFFDRLHRTRFALAVVTAGPFMLCNDATEAWREGRIAGLSLAIGALVALVWTMALGVFLIAIVARITG